MCRQGTAVSGAIERTCRCWPEGSAGIAFDDYHLGTLPEVSSKIQKAGPKPRGYETITAGGKSSK